MPASGGALVGLRRAFAAAAIRRLVVVRLAVVLAGAECLVELGLVRAGVVERAAPLPVQQRQPRGHAHVRPFDRLALLPGRVRDGGLAGDQVAAHAVDAQARARGRDPQELRIAELHAAQPGLGGRDLAGHAAFGGFVVLGAGRRSAVVREPGPDHRGALGRVVARDHRHAQPEPVQQLRAQLAFLRVHGAHEQEGRGVPQRDALPLHARGAGRGRVQQHVHDVVGQQVDLVDVEHAAVGQRQQARGERLCGRRPGQHAGHVEAAGDVLVGGAERQFDQAHRTVGRPAARRVRAVGAGRVGLGRVAGEPALGHHVDAGQDPARPRTSVVLAVPFSPVSSTPPSPGSTAPSSSASRASSCPTTAVNGSPLMLDASSSSPSTWR